VTTAALSYRYINRRTSILLLFIAAVDIIF